MQEESERERKRKPLEQNKIYEFPFEISLKNNKEISL
jgi:hypothetical protein